MKIKYKIPINHIVNSNYFIPSLDQESWKSNKLSWFDIEDINYNVTSNNLNKDIKNIINETSNIRSKQIRLYPDITQTKLLLKWIDLARIIYNITVKYFRKNKLISFIKARKIIKDSFTKEFKNNIKFYNLPIHVIDQSIHDVIKSYKTCISLIKCKHIKNFNIRYKKQSKPQQSIVIEKEDFSKNKNGFYIRNLKEIKSTSPIKQENIKHECRLSYNFINKKFILFVPEDKITKVNFPDNKTCSIDPGNKTFLTIYNENGKCKKVFNRDKINKLNFLVRRKMILKELYEKSYNSKFKKAYLKNNLKIQNYIKELHYKSSIYLCLNYENIYLGKLSTKSIISKSNNLSKFEKIYSLALSHCKFRSILENKCKEFNRNLKICNEHYTSLTCGNCGNINKNLGSSRTYDCKKCLISIDRDLNGARNILIKHT
jgi:putative transposase